MTFTNRDARTSEGTILPPHGHLVEEAEWRITLANKLELSTDQPIELQSVLFMRCEYFG